MLGIPETVVVATRPVERTGRGGRSADRRSLPTALGAADRVHRRHERRRPHQAPPRAPPAGSPCVSCMAGTLCRMLRLGVGACGARRVAGHGRVREWRGAWRRGPSAGTPASGEAAPSVDTGPRAVVTQGIGRHRRVACSPCKRGRRRAAYRAAEWVSGAPPTAPDAAGRTRRRHERRRPAVRAYRPWRERCAGCCASGTGARGACRVAGHGRVREWLGAWRRRPSAGTPASGETAHPWIRVSGR